MVYHSLSASLPTAQIFRPPTGLKTQYHPVLGPDHAAVTRLLHARQNLATDGTDGTDRETSVKSVGSVAQTLVPDFGEFSRTAAPR